MNAMKKKSNHPVLKKEIRERERKKSRYTQCVCGGDINVFRTFFKKEKKIRSWMFIFFEKKIFLFSKII